MITTQEFNEMIQSDFDTYHGLLFLYSAQDYIGRNPHIIDNGGSQGQQLKNFINTTMPEIAYRYEQRQATINGNAANKRIGYKRSHKSLALRYSDISGAEQIGIAWIPVCIIAAVLISGAAYAYSVYQEAKTDRQKIASASNLLKDGLLTQSQYLEVMGQTGSQESGGIFDQIGQGVKTALIVGGVGIIGLKFYNSWQERKQRAKLLYR